MQRDGTGGGGRHRRGLLQAQIVSFSASKRGGGPVIALGLEAVGPGLQARHAPAPLSHTP